MTLAITEKPGDILVISPDPNTTITLTATQPIAAAPHEPAIAGPMVVGQQITITPALTGGQAVLFAEYLDGVATGRTLPANGFGHVLYTVLAADITPASPSSLVPTMTWRAKNARGTSADSNGLFGIVAASMASGSDFFRGGATAFSGAALWVHMESSLDAQPAADDFLFMLTLQGGGGGGPVSLLTEATGFGRARVCSFENADDEPHIHIQVDGEIGRTRIDDVWIDPVRGWIYHAQDGELMGSGVASGGLTSLGHATNPLGINTSALSDATRQYGAMSFIEFQTSSVSPTMAQIRAASARTRKPGAPLPGSIKTVVASSAGGPGASIGASIPDLAATLTVTKHGAPTLISRDPLARPIGRGVWEWKGDSLSSGKTQSGSTGNGPREAFQQRMVARGFSMAQDGKYVLGNAPGTSHNSDGRHSALPSQSLGVVSGGQPTYLSQAQADLAARISTRNVGWFGANDIIQRIDGNGQTPAQCMASMIADWNTWKGYIDADGTILEFLWLDVMRQGTPITTANSRAGIEMWSGPNGVLAGLVRGWQVSPVNGTLHHFYSVHDDITPTQSVADDGSRFFDYIHLLPQWYAAVGTGAANAV